MPSKHLSLRLEPETLERLDQEGRRSGRTRSEVAKTLLEEGLRMEVHPGVVFRSGPAGGRPALADGPDISEVARVLRAQKGKGEEVVRETAKLTGLSVQQVRIAVRYYADYQEEIDEWLRGLDELAEREEDAWSRQQDLDLTNQEHRLR